MPRTIFLLLAGLFLMAQGVPAPVPRDIPGPPPAPGVTPPERIERPPVRPDGVIIPQPTPSGGVIVPPVMPPMPQADVPEERPGTTPLIRPPGEGTSGPPGTQMR